MHNVTIYKKYKSTMYIKFTYPCYSISLIQIILKCQSFWINLIEKNHFRQLTSTLIAVGGRICKFPIKGFMCFVSLFVYLSQRYWKELHLFVLYCLLWKCTHLSEELCSWWLIFFTQALTWIAIVRVDYRFTSVWKFAVGILSAFIFLS